MSDTRPCTCHPDDKPPVPCAKKYALSDCRLAEKDARIAELEELVKSRDNAICALIDDDTKDNRIAALEALRIAAKPFGDYARELMKCNGRSLHGRTEPVTGCNDVTITTEHCRVLIDALNPLPKHEQAKEQAR